MIDLSLPWQVIHGDCLEVMRQLPDGCVDAVVTDPPYGLAFMGKAWDHGVPGPEFWREALRVAKPGAHLVAFGGTRTYHRLTCAIEDAGWEIRDCLSWLYGSGFPKSHDVSKAMDKAAGAEREVTGECSVPNYKSREKWGNGESTTNRFTGERRDTPATALAREWQGWGTALKPAWEPIILARKPLTGTVASNVAQHGTGALNVDGCRIGTEGARSNGGSGKRGTASYGDYGPTARIDYGIGRWPANVCLDEEAAGMLDAQTGNKGASGKASGPTLTGESTSASRGKFNGVTDTPFYGDSGGASRFFYTSKAPQKERWGILTCECKAASVPLWENADQNHDALTDATSPQKDTSGVTLGDASDSNTPLSGSKPTDQSPTDGTFTTSAATSRTTDSATCGLSAQPNTSASTADANCAMGYGGSRATDAASASPSTPTTGTSVGKGGPSTGDVGPVTLLRSYTTNACGRCGANFKVESHATVKPIALMRWLCRLVTPKGGLILDPFTGSGTTGCAAVLEGFRFVGIEREPEYAEIAEKRIAHWTGQVDAPTLFEAP